MNKKLNKFLANDNLRNKIAKKGRLKYHSQYNSKIIAETLKKALLDRKSKTTKGKEFIDNYLNNIETVSEWEKLILL